MSKLKWTFETCEVEAKKYSSRSEFKKKQVGAYNTAVNNKWLDIIGRHMIRPKHLHKWSYEDCEIEAKKYSYRNDFSKCSKGIYLYAQKNRWLDKICNHMTTRISQNLKWSYNTCEIEAKKYASKKEFENNCSGGYSAAVKKKWISNICDHMIRPKPTNFKWTYEACEIEAKKYIAKSIFAKNSSSAYCAARQNNWLSLICKHMPIKGDLYRRYVYMFIFSDKSMYIGLTYNYDQRTKRHLSDPKSQVYKYILLTGIIPEFQLITNEPISIEQATQLEISSIAQYKNNGFMILNKSNGGEVGSVNHKWTYEACQAEAKKYNSKSEFKNKSKSAYVAAARNKWIKIICSHMIEIKKPNGYWNYEKCKIKARQYDTRGELRKNFCTVYNCALKNKWLEEFYPKNNQ